MPQIQQLPGNPGFGSQLGAQLGASIGQGLSGAASSYFQQKRNKSSASSLINSVLPNADAGTKQTWVKALSSLEPADQVKAFQAISQAQLEQQFLQQYLRPQPVEESTGQPAQQGMQPRPSRQSGQQEPLAPPLTPTLKAIGEQQLAQRKMAQQKEQAFFKVNEPKLLEISDQQKSLEDEDLRFQRMQELNTDPSKFPNAKIAAFLTKEGQLRPTASAFLSPEAQEFVKLIVDSTSGIKDTYGARVTNFDLSTYLKKLPSLINTPEGRDRILRDLRLMNEITRLHIEGIQQIFEEAGGSGAIPYSEAERIFRKRFQPQINELRKEFVNPKKSSFESIPSASAYKGQIIEDEETGEKLISDGKSWQPFQGK